jgi:hypothetical protein
MPREAPVTIAVFCRSATSIFLLSNRLVGSCHPQRWLQALIDVTGGYLKGIAIAERTSRSLTEPSQKLSVSSILVRRPQRQEAPPMHPQMLSARRVVVLLVGFRGDAAPT